MTKTKNPPKKAHRGEYTDKELYEGYYWLILHVDPNALVDSVGTRKPEIIPEGKFKCPMPDCVKSAIKAKTVMQTFSREEVDRLNKGLTPEHSLYFSPEPHPTYEIDDIFDWLLQDKDVPTLRLANDKEIRTWRDIRELWEEADVPFQDLREAKTFGTGVKTLVPVPDEEQYSEDHFYSLESHLAKQHQENLKRLAQPGQGEVKDKETSSPQTTAPWDWKWLIDKIFEVIKLFNRQ